MANPKRFELEELVNRPGTYFNPQTEVLVVVDDSPELDSEVLDLGDHEPTDGTEATEWVLVSEETPLEENRRDELLEAFRVRHHAHTAAHDGDDAPDELDEDQLEVDAE
ncbi:MAG: hypothetical protein ACR2OB_03310 [Solirubrobacteraceae bacterium]